MVGLTAADDLEFSDLTTVNLRLFADLGMQPIAREQKWLRGMRATLSVDNLFDERQDVKTSQGTTPISYQPAPGLDGTASRRIREQVAALEAAYGRCDRKRLERLMQPLLLHLDELQKVEAAKAAGADPIRAEHMLPNAANSAYDLARRALWHADDRMAAACAG